MVKTRRRKSSQQQGDNVSLLDDPDASPERYSLHVGGGTSSIRKSKNRESQSLRNGTALPPESRFAPQHDPKAASTNNTQLVPRTGGALQFVPAYEESGQEEAPAPTWDAIIEADAQRGRSLSWGRKPKIPSNNKSHSVDRSISSVESAGTGIFRKKGGKLRKSPVRSGSSKSPGKRPLGTAVPRTSVSPSKQRPEVGSSRGNNNDGTSIVSTASSRKGTRIARLASLFSSRSVVAKDADAAPILTPESQRLVRSKNAVSSPPPSESSNDYSGWPGTQDKRGGTVAIQSSYDDSSVGAAGVTTFHRKKYDLNMDDDDVEEEVRKWMNDPSFDDSTATDRSPPRQHRPSKLNVSQESKSSVSRNISYESSNIMSEPSFTDEEENPADFHLAALVANASSNAPRSPLAETMPSPSQSLRRKQLNEARAKRQTGVPGYAGRPRSAKSTAGSTTSALSINHLFGDERKQPRNSPSREQQIKQAFDDDPWDVDEYERTPSSAGTSVSKSSSAFFQTRGVSESQYGIQPNMRDLTAKTRRMSESPTKTSSSRAQPPTEKALATNERFSAAQRAINARNSRGYRGFLDKTKEVPNLMDALDSDSVASSKATSAYMPSNLHVQRGISAVQQAPNRDTDEGSDIFDGLSVAESDIFSSVGVEPRQQQQDYGKKDGSKGVNVVRLAGGLTAIQTTQSDLDKRTKADDFDENLTNSSIDYYGYAKLPAFREMAAAGRKGNDTAKYIPPSSNMVSPTGQPIRAPITSRTKATTSRNMFESSLAMSESGASDNAMMGTLRGYYEEDLSEYSINPRQAKQLVKRYRELCDLESAFLTGEELAKQEDEKKAFALLEMRSRVMEKDMERGLERQGGTVPVDDLVTTPYNQAAYRVRDAVIVSKAWRDGASPKDVVTASLLTQADERIYYIKRPVWYRNSQTSYYLEPVRWLDDTDFTQMRCPSLGPRCMRGFEIFTIGDCQSILLKLTNERCMDLRHELNEATARQLEAEDLMKEEGDTGDGMMTEAEMTFLSSMEEVKTISKRLVVAEKSFELVRERIEKLVAKYETLLVKIENDSIVAPSSVLTNGSSYYTDGFDDSNYSSEEEAEKIKLERRARRAELRAEVAAREALMAKQEAKKIKEEKQQELDALQQKLIELQAESSTIIAEREREKSMVLAKNIAHETQSAVQERTTPRISQDKINGVKQKFRDRMAERMRSSPEVRASPENSTSPLRRSPPPTPEHPMARTQRPPISQQNIRLRQTAGEEMFSHLDFYERSLKSVEKSRENAR